jgi:zinc protease
LRTRTLALAIVSLATLATLRAQVAAPPQSTPAPALVLDQALPVDPAVRTGRLPNGLRYYIRQNRRPDNRVSLRLAVDAGSIQEADDQRGLAHFLEHMAFNGTEHFKPGELITFLESIGARFGPHVNASTSFDETIYMLEVPTDREGYVDRGLLSLRDFAAGISLVPEEIEKERGVVIEEWRGRLGAGSRLVDKQLPVLLRGSRYAERLPIGTPEILKSFPHARLAEFYRRWYRPDRMAVVVAGDIEPAEAQRLVEKHFAPIAAGGAPAAPFDREVPPHADTLVSVATDPEAQSSTVSIVVKRPVEIERTVGDYRQALVEQLVVQMLNLRLREIARRADAPFVAAEAGGAEFVRPIEAFELTAVVADGGAARGLEALMLEARRAQQFGFGQAELDRAKAELMATYERAFKERETSESRSYADEYVRAFLESEPIPGIEFEYRLASTFLPDVTLDEVAATARRLVRPDNRVVLAVAPEKKEVAAPTEDALRAAISRGEAATVEAWSDALAGRALVERPPAAGKVTSQRTIPEIGVTVLTLSNGVDVWLKPTDFKADQVLVSSYALGGASLATEADFREASLGPALVTTGGLGGFNPVDLSRLLAGKIAQVSPQVEAYTHGTSGQASPRDLEAAFQLQYLVFTAPNLTPESLDLLKRRLITLVENQANNPRAVFRERVELVNTSNHYSANALTVADVQALDLAAMRRYYQARFANAADFTFFIVGAFAVDGIVPKIEQWIASLPSTTTRAAAFRDLEIRFPATIVKEEVLKGQEPASQTVMSFFADTGLEELEMHRARAAASLLGIRLREILREELAGTYGVSVSYQNLQPQKGYGVMTIQFGSAPENVEKLVGAVMAEVGRLKAGGPTADDVARVQELERRDLETALRQNQYWAGSLQSTHILGWDPVGITRRGERIEKLSPGMLHEMFKKYFPMDRYTVVTLRPQKGN